MRILKEWNWDEVTTSDIAYWTCLMLTGRPSLSMIVDGDRKKILTFE
jgi:hypothetical protein